MPVPLYLDHDSGSRALVRALRQQGIDVLTSFETGNERLPDPEQLSFAASAGRLLYTANTADYARLHFEWLRSGRGHAGIVARRWQRTSIGAQIAWLVALCNENDATSVRGRIFYT